jgi:26S proteasome regulatory subunit N10
VDIGGGNADFAKALQVSALALKHRRNKNGGQRIVAFVGSPIADDEAKLVKLAKNLKKNNIAVDIVSMGEHEANEPKLKAFMEAVDKNSNSHLVIIPPGVLPSEVIMSSPIITGGEEGGDVGMGGGGGGGGAAAAAFAEYGGVDPSLDPELAMALRASMEEERARMAAASGATGDVGSAEPGTAPGEAQTPAAASKESAAQGPADDDEELLRQALLMSMNDNPPEAGETSAAQEQPGAEDEDEDEDAKALALALAMSKEEEEPAPTGSATSAPSSQPPIGGFLDPSYVNELLEGIEGVNMDDPQIKALLAQYPSSDTKPGDGPDSKKQKKEDEDK